MLRFRLALLLTTATAAFVPPRPAEASGFSDFDPVREVVVFGRVRAADALVEAPAAFTMGPWLTKPGELARDPAAKGNTLWIPKSEPAHFRDGTVRVRVTPGAKIDFGVLLRVRWAKGALERTTGYELSIDAKGARFLRWDRGRVLPMAGGVDMKKLEKRKSLEIVVLAVGPQIVAMIHDGETLERLATLAVHDTTHGAGCAALRTGALHEGGAFTLMSVMDAGALPPTPKPKFGQLYVPATPSDVTPFGNTRFVFVATDELKRLPKDLRGAERERMRHDDGVTEAMLFLDTIQYERLLRSKVPIRRVASIPPWSATDARYRARRGKPPTKTKRGVRIDESYKDARMVEDILRAYHERYPELTTFAEIGKTHQGRAIWALKISDNAENDEDEPAVLLNATHHGSELLSTEFALDAMQRLLEDYGRDKEITRWVDQLEIWVVPMVNPDGNATFIDVSKFATRKNGRDDDRDGAHDPFEGVDLNRNYPWGWGPKGSSRHFTHKHWRGPSAASEPETKAMMRLADAQHFAAVISFHTIGTKVFVPYAVPGVKSPEPNVARIVGEELAAAAPEQANAKFFAVKPNRYPVAGGDQDWHYHEHGSLAYIIEGSHHNPPSETRDLAVERTRPIWRTLLERVRHGPRISGHVRDATGKPVKADVVIDEIALLEDEHWRARERDGRFDRVLPKPGRYTVRARAPGFREAKAEVKVKDVATIDLVLEKQ